MVELEPSRTRFMALFGVIILAGGLLAFLFHDPGALTIHVEGATAPSGGVAMYNVTILVPSGQRFPMRGVSAVIEDARVLPPVVIGEGDCRGDGSCGRNLTALGPHGASIVSIERLPDGASANAGPLVVRLQGYGHSETTGYGQEVEPVRQLVASDVTDAIHGVGYGLGFGDAHAPVTLQYVVRIDASTLPASSLRLTFLVDTGSHAMGPLSSAAFPFTTS